MTENKERTEKIQEKYFQFQSLKDQIKQINEHIEHINERIEEISNVINNVQELIKVKKGTEILVPISNGLFIKAKTEDTDNFLVNVGSKAVVVKNEKQVRELLEKQKIELVELHQKMNDDLKTSETEAIQLQKEIKSMMN